MQCPVDGETLVMADRQGVEIDYCPKCRGVWLDRGELDKIIEREMGQRGGPPHEERRDDRRDDRRVYESRSDQPKKRKRESFLSELFDF
jgi:hypothetical protein